LTSFAFDPTQKLSVYSGDMVVKAVIIPQRAAPTGTYTVHGEFKYQACDNNACYPPKKLPVQFDLKVSKGTRKSTRPRPNRQSPNTHYARWRSPALSSPHSALRQRDILVLC